MNLKFARSLALSCAAMCLCALPAAAQAPAARAKDITFLISHPAGGGYDAYARLFARHLPRFLDGHPAVSAQNMPGAAGVVMTNSMATQQRNDGSVIALGPGSLGMADLLGAAGARFDAGALSWIGSMNRDVPVAVSWKTSPIATSGDLMANELVVGGGGATDQSVVFPTALNRILGTKFKIVTGYPGTADMTLALERGEIAGIAMNYSSIIANRPAWARDHLVHFLLQMSLERHPGLPTTPTVIELAQTDDQRRVLELVFSQSDISRVIFAPPGLAPDRLKALRAAFDAMMVDREFLDDASKSGIEINRPMPGGEVEALVKKLHAASPELVKRAAEAARAP